MITQKGKTCAELGITNEALTKYESLRFYDVREEPFRVYGLIDTGEEFIRMPGDVAATVNPGVAGMFRHVTGGRVRFVTTSNIVALHAIGRGPGTSLNRTTIASAGYDLYINRSGHDTFAGVFRPPYDTYDAFSEIRALPSGEKEITINFPITTGCKALYIGLDEASTLSRRGDYKFEKPVLYYGSSITHGIGASRPGMQFPSLISRRLDCNFVNLGFSGNAKGEDTMVEYLAAQECSVFVLDYDHNAPNAEYLQQTHEKTYLGFRKTHPDTPVVMVGRPDFFLLNDSDADRRDVIFTTYKNARARGEKVLFVDGQSLFQGDCREECTVDGCHPNDIGMARMADVIGKAVEFALSM